MPQLLIWTSLLSMIVATTQTASAQGTPAIDEATFVAELATRDVRRAIVDARIAAARADAAAARVRPNPSLSIEREETFVDGGGVPTNYLRLTVPFDISGRRGLELDAANAAVTATTSDAAQSQHELANAALRVFDEATHARLQFELLTATRASLVRAVEIARQRGRAGAGSGYELQRFELELAQHDDELASAEIALHRLRLQLATLVGRTGELDAAGTLALPAAAPALDGLVAKASARGDLRAAQLRIDAADRRIRAGGRGWVPVLALTAGAMTADLGDQTGTGYVAGLSITIPIFDRGQVDRERGRAERQAATATTRVLQREIPSAVRAAHSTLTARLEQARRLATGQLERLDVILRAAETAFREGNAGVVELLDAHRVARTVRMRELELRHQVARDRRELELAVGQRL